MGDDELTREGLLPNRAGQAELERRKLLRRIKELEAESALRFARMEHEAAEHAKAKVRIEELYGQLTRSKERLQLRMNPAKPQCTCGPCPVHPEVTPNE